MLSRRAFIALSSAITIAPSWSSVLGKTDKSFLYGSAFSRSQDHYFGIFDDTGELLWNIPLTARAHAPVAHPKQAIIGIVARRPGFFIDFFNVSNHKKIKRIEPTKNHHFYGHALFSRDGTRLITQENHFPSGQGKIFIREWPSGKVLQTYGSNGIGPHESVLLNEEILVIANGGLKTHPDKDRDILNLESMKPNLTYVSLNNGKVLNEASNKKELHQLSIRHLAVNSNGVIVAGFQYQGDAWDKVPLVGLSTIDNPNFSYLPMPETIRARFKQYCGSVCFDSSGQIVAISSPKGGLVAYWDVQSKTFLGVDNCRDVCGLAPTNNAYEFLLTSGSGLQLKSNAAQNSQQLIKKHSNIHWDNHLRQFIV